MSSEYRYHLSVSSQFPYCGIPLRLDTYSKCQFACRYCFASARGGATGDERIKVADPSALARRLNRLSSGAEARSALDEMLAARIPIHFGGMSDPFMPLELKRQNTLEFLRVLSDFAYPTIVSTKGILAAEEPYVSLLSRPEFAVQFSITSASDRDSEVVDVGAPATSERLRAARTLVDAGAKVAIRHQPLLPTKREDALFVIEAAAKAGATHYAIEHLKLPIEQSWSHRKQLNDAAGADLNVYFNERRAIRVGREWILPTLDRFQTIIRMKRAANEAGLSFGAADNDLLHLSDGNVCCSGADLLGMGGGFQFNFLSAVRRGAGSGEVCFDSIRGLWRPTRSIAQYVNSNSREAGQTVEAFLRKRWNGASNGPSPTAFFGVYDDNRLDAQGFKIYRLAEDVRQLMAEASTAHLLAEAV